MVLLVDLSFHGRLSLTFSSQQRILDIEPKRRQNIAMAEQQAIPLASRVSPSPARTFLVEHGNAAILWPNSTQYRNRSRDEDSPSNDPDETVSRHHSIIEREIALAFLSRPRLRKNMNLGCTIRLVLKSFKTKPKATMRQYQRQTVDIP